MKRIIILFRLISITLCVTLLAGCTASEHTVSSQSVLSSLSVNPEGSSSEENIVTRSSAGKLVIYTPHDADPMNAGITEFMSKYPDIEVEIIAGGTGELLSKVKDEAADPVADVLWGGGADSMEAYSEYFQPYKSENITLINSNLYNKDYYWTGESPLPMVIIYNKKILNELGADIPNSWQDLLSDKLKGNIAYCMPSKSGSAYTQLCTMILANGGSEKGWEYVTSFISNLNGKIMESSSKCHKLVVSGEYAVGITIEKSAALYNDNENIGFSYPSEGTSDVPDAISIIKGCHNLDNAKLFVDFVTSYECQSAQSGKWQRRPSRNDVIQPNGLISLDDINIISYDFKWAADNKETNIDKFNILMGI